MKRREELFWKYVDKKSENECWLWKATTTKGGYGQVNYKGERTTAHRIAYKLTKGDIEPGNYIMHTCDNPACCNPSHLISGTQKENIADMRLKGRAGDCRNFGPQNRGKIISFETCQEIRRIYAEGNTSQTELSKRFKLAQSHVSRIIRSENRSML